MTGKLKGIKPGDRVRLTKSAMYVGWLQGQGMHRFEVGGVSYLDVSETEIDLDATFAIERIEPPIKVGDTVRFRGMNYDLVVLAVDDDMAWVRSQVNGERTSSNLLALVKP